jgi:protein-tyrosine phosphatase
VKILLVCTGNICRSPAAACLLTSALGPDSGVSVSTAGTGAADDVPVHPYIVDALAERQVACEGTSRRVTPGMVNEVDVVLGLERAHRELLTSWEPAWWDKVFTLREFVALAERVPPPVTVESVARARRYDPLPLDFPLDVADPFGSRWRRPYRRCVAELAELTQQLSVLLKGS